MSDNMDISPCPKCGRDELGGGDPNCPLCGERTEELPAGAAFQSEEEVTSVLYPMLRDARRLAQEIQADEAAKTAELGAKIKEITDAYDAVIQSKQMRLRDKMPMIERLSRLLIELDPVKKSRMTPWGQIGERRQRPRIEIQDDAAVWAWINEHHITDPVSLEPPKPKLSLVKLYALQMKQDHAIPGTRLIDDGDKFFFTPTPAGGWATTEVTDARD